MHKTQIQLFAHNSSKCLRTFVRRSHSITIHLKLTFESCLFMVNTSVQAEISRLDPYVSSFGTGMLGRLTDMLSSKSFNVNSFAVDSTLTAIQGNDIQAIKSSVNSAEGFKHFNPSAPVSNITSSMLLLNAKESEHDGFFSQFWSSSLVSRIFNMLITLINIISSHKTNAPLHMAA